MKKYTTEEQRIYQAIMMDIRANWRVLIGYMKERNNATSSFDWDAKDYAVTIEYFTLSTLYRVLKMCFRIEIDVMDERLKNYRYYGKCVKWEAR